MPLLSQLKQFFRPLAPEGIALAYSGGVDSTLLLSALQEMQSEEPFPMAVLTMRTRFQTDDEIAEAVSQAETMGAAVRLFSFDPLSLPQLRDNPPDRCYWCKRHVFTAFRKHCHDHGIAHLADGTNADDRHAYRPGLRALAELGVRSPLCELGIGKAAIRECARLRNLPCAQRPAMPCLATRFEYGTRLEPQMLDRVAKGEALLRRYLPGNSVLRLRVQHNLARIETAPSSWPCLIGHHREIAEGLHALGFDYAAMDLDGYRCGCYDRPSR